MWGKSAKLNEADEEELAALLIEVVGRSNCLSLLRRSPWRWNIDQHATMRTSETLSTARSAQQPSSIRGPVNARCWNRKNMPLNALSG